MRRSLLLPVLVLAALGPAASGAAAKPRPLAQVLLSGCESSLDRGAREAVFEGRMRALKGAVKLQQRFRLERSADAPGTQWFPVTASGFDRWKSAEVGVRRYVLTKTVANLAAPAAYRVTVRFRWVGADGRVIRRRTRVSPVCRQTDMRPDLRVTRIDVARTLDPAHSRYTLSVRNTGRSGAGPFEVVLNHDGADRPAGTLPGLAPGALAYVEVTGPACTPGVALMGTADAGSDVDEALESNNTFGRLCSFGAS